VLAGGDTNADGLSSRRFEAPLYARELADQALSGSATVPSNLDAARRQLDQEQDGESCKPAVLASPNALDKAAAIAPTHG
jgi:hypothetical protein